MSDLIAIAYDDVAQAERVVSNLGEAVKSHVIELDDLEVSADKVLPEIEEPGTVIQTSLNDEDEQRPEHALQAARS